MEIVLFLESFDKVGWIFWEGIFKDCKVKKVDSWFWNCGSELYVRMMWVDGCNEIRYVMVSRPYDEDIIHVQKCNANRGHATEIRTLQEYGVYW